MGTTKLSPVPLFGIGTFGKSATVDAQKRVNLYAEISTDPEKGSMITLYGTPGTSMFSNLGVAPARGMWEKGDYVYSVNGANLYRIANDGTFTLLGTLATASGRVDMCDNGLQLIVVDGTPGAPGGGYIYTFLTGVFATITTANFPGGDTVTFLNGYFIVSKPASGQFNISALYDGTTWAALDFATAESDPDDLVRVLVDTGTIMLFGNKTTEFWGDSGAQDFPFARIGSSAIQWGIAARWSLARFMDSLIFLRKNRLGRTQVALLNGFKAQAISTPEMEYLFQQYPAVSDATGFSYMESGHAFYQINFPSANVSWLYDGLSQSWSIVQTNGGRHIAEIQINYLDRSLVSDYASGKLYTFNALARTDNGLPITRKFIGRHTISNGNWMALDELWIEMQPGVGTSVGQGVDPVLMLRVSKDGGITYGNEIQTPIGKIGEYRRRAVFRRLGRSRDWVFEFTVTDPVYTVFVSAWGRYGT